MVMAAAFGGRAGFVVGLDRYLLDLGEVRRVRVLRPGDFLPELRAERG
jgi:predicted nucleic acid-binding protein